MMINRFLFKLILGVVGFLLFGSHVMAGDAVVLRINESDWNRFLKMAVAAKGLNFGEYNADSSFKLYSVNMTAFMIDIQTDNRIEMNFVANGSAILDLKLLSVTGYLGIKGRIIGRFVVKGNSKTGYSVLIQPEKVDYDASVSGLGLFDWLGQSIVDGEISKFIKDLGPQELGPIYLGNTSLFTTQDVPEIRTTDTEVIVSLKAQPIGQFPGSKPMPTLLPDMISPIEVTQKTIPLSQIVAESYLPVGQIVRGTIPGWFGAENQGSDVAVGDIDANGLPEVVVAHIDNPRGENQGYFRIGWDMSGHGVIKRWSNVIRIPGWFGAENQRMGLALRDLNRNGILDLIVFHIDNPRGENSGFYRVGWDMDRSGNASRWSSVNRVPGWFGAETHGVDISAVDVDGNGITDLVVLHNDGPPGEDRGYYRIGWNVETNGTVSSWSGVKALPAGLFGHDVVESGLDLMDIDKNGRPEMVVAYVDNPPGDNSLVYFVGWNMDKNGNFSSDSWRDRASVNGLGHDTSGAGIAISSYPDGSLAFLGHYLDNPPGENVGGMIYRRLFFPSSQLEFLKSVIQVPDEYPYTIALSPSTGVGAPVLQGDITYGGLSTIRLSPGSDNSASSFEMAISVSSDRVLVFNVKVSSELMGDFFNLYVNDRLVSLYDVYGLSGEVEWRSIDVPLSAGSYRIRWEYRKDKTLSAGRDAAWLSSIRIQ